MSHQSEHMSADRISAYLGGGLSQSDRNSLERHLLVCADCRRDLAEASELVGAKRSRWLTVGAPLAAAAVLVIAIIPNTRSNAAGPTLRGPQVEGLAKFAVVSPSNEAEVKPDSLVFRWRSVGADAHFQFTLTDANGDVVYTGATPDTALTLPRSVGLTPGATYFWYVDALLEGARSTTTGVIEFTVQP